MKMIRITREVWTKDGDFYLTVTVIRRLARHVEKRTGEKKLRRPKRSATLFDPTCPFRFIDPKTVETIEEDQNNVRTCDLSKIPYHVLKRLCQSQNCCAAIESVAAALDVDEESVINAVDDKINGGLRRRGIGWKVERKNGFLTLKRTDG